MRVVATVSLYALNSTQVPLLAKSEKANEILGNVVLSLTRLTWNNRICYY